MEGNRLIFYVNGQKVVEPDPDPSQSLLAYLRNKLLLVGTKSACGQGACGACTVMVSRKDRQQDAIRHYAVTACLVPVCSLHGLAITTVEGIGSVNTKLHPVQEMLVKAHGTQCGFCTPGFVMSMYTLLRNDPEPTMEQVNRAIRGNLCRCTGYRPILDGFKPFTKDFCPMGDQCCQRTSSEGSTDSGEVNVAGKKLFDASQEPIFPSELQLSGDLDSQYLAFQRGTTSWLRPTSLNQLLVLKAQHPGARIVAGNTTLGLERSSQDKHYPVLLSASRILEMSGVTLTDTGARYGAAMSLSAIEEHIASLESIGTDPKLCGLKTFATMLETFAALQIKNLVSIGGCVASCWANSDVVPLLCVLGAQVEVAAKGKAIRTEDLTPEFFKGPGQSSLGDSEVIIAVAIPYTRKNQFTYSIKHAIRDFDTPIVSTAAMVTMAEGRDVIQDANICFGNVLPKVYNAKRLSEGLKGKTCDSSLADTALILLQAEFSAVEAVSGTPIAGDLRSLVEASVWKLVLGLVRDVQGDKAVPSDLLSAVTPLPDSLPRGTQVFEDVPADQPACDSVGRPIVHRAARQQATGEAQFIDDIPHYENELFVSLVVSPHAHARVKTLLTADALAMPGVVDVLTSNDVSGSNQYGAFIPDETVFADKEVTFVGHTVAAVLATSQQEADSAAKLVHVEYEVLPSITTTQEAIAAESFFEELVPMRYSFGDVDSAMSSAEVVVEGQVEIQGQEHFYMETQRALVVPLKEDDEIAVYGPYQAMTGVQKTVAMVLGIPYHKIAIKCKRAGGAFGGKETKMMSTLPAAVGAFKHKRPVRCVFDRDTDMQLTGGRHPVLAKYKIGVKKDGTVVALQTDYYVNGGHTTDASLFVAQAIIESFDNCYRVPNVHLKGNACRTNLPSNTAMRGFGQPQSIFVMESIITHAASVLGLTQRQMRERNLYRPGDLLPFNCTSETLNIGRCWDEVIQRSQFEERQAQIEEYNRANKYRKRGMAVGPMKFGLQYPVRVLNQGQALVNIYLDGSVLVHHGGIEMGQGLHTKIIQIASRALQRPVDTIHNHLNDTNIVNNATGSGGSSTCDMQGHAVMITSRALGVPVTKILTKETNSDVICNGSYSGGSLSTELQGQAVWIACEKLTKRLSPYKDAKPEGDWVDWVNAAYNDRVSLSAAGFYKVGIDDLGYNWQTGKGRGFSYYSCGTACTEVEIDILTGQHVVLRTDIVMDVGRSLNPAIDIGQIEGAFMQGYGLYALEDLKFDNNGKLKTRNALGYKIPVVANVPKEFNISLLKDSDNPRAVYCSKGIGEPPLLLATTVLFAIREAIGSYRKQQGLEEYFRLDAPATAAVVRRVCPK